MYYNCYNIIKWQNTCRTETPKHPKSTHFHFVPKLEYTLSQEPSTDKYSATNNCLRILKVPFTENVIRVLV